MLKPFVDSMAQEIARALQFFFTSTPHNRVDYVLLAGGSAALPGLTSAVTRQTSFACSLVNPFDGMEIGERHAREEGAARGAVLPDLLRPGDAEVPAVILINLLPHREAARKRRREAFYATLGVCRAAGRPDRRRGITSGTRPRFPSQQAKNGFLQTEITKLEAEIKEISTLQAEIAALRARQQAVEDLQGDRNLPVHLLNELVRQLPDGVYLTSMKQDNQTVTLQGMAQSNERVSELLRNLGNNSPWLVKPELVEITSGTVNLSPRDQRRVANFTMRIGLKRPTDAQKAARRRSRTARRGRSQGLGVDHGNTNAPPERSTSLPPLRRFGDQFRGLNPNDPSVWPPVPRYALCVAVDGAGAGGAVVRLAHQFERRTRSRARQGSRAQGGLPEEGRAGRQPRRAEEAARAGAAVRDPAREAAAQQGRNGCAAVRHQPGRARAAACSSNCSGPGRLSVKDYYAELPIAVRVTGRYHDMGAFAADIANLSRIVTLNNLTVTPQKDGALTMDATARTFRYLDEEEQAQRRSAPQRGSEEEMRCAQFSLARRCRRSA